MTSALGKFHFITAFPDMIDQALSWGVVGQARKKGLIDLHCENPRVFTEDVHQTIDDRPFGGGDGMIYLAEPLSQAIQKSKVALPKASVIYLSPQGEPLTDRLVQDLAQDKEFILLCGRYGGIDQRVIEHSVDREISIGDYVLSGGELAACVLVDAVARQWPGVLGHQESANRESFRNGLLEAPLFTRPREMWGMSVPEILFSGHHAKIEEWKRCASWLVTEQKRPDLFQAEKSRLSEKDKARLEKDLEAFRRRLSENDKISLGLQ